MIPFTIIERLQFLIDQVGEHELGAEMTRAEIRGMETVIEAWRAQEPQPAEVEPRDRRRSIRGLVLDLVRREPGLAPAQIAERIGCRKSQVDSAVAYWRSGGEMDLRFGDGCYLRDPAQEAAQ